MGQCRFGREPAACHLQPLPRRVGIGPIERTDGRDRGGEIVHGERRLSGADRGLRTVVRRTTDASDRDQSLDPIERLFPLTSIFRGWV